VRLSIYVLLLGEKGTGKGYAIAPLQHALGGDAGHAPEITPERYCNRFNKRKANARVIIIHELPKEFRDKALAAEFDAELKRDADANELYRPLEPKGRDELFIDRNCTVVITSNYDPCWPIEYGERRLFALRTSDKLAQHDPIARPWGEKDVGYWSELWQWMNTNGPADVLAYALQYDLAGFNPGLPPPVTDELQRLMDKGVSGYKGFLLSLKRDANRVLDDLGIPPTIGYIASDHLLRLFKAFVHPEATVSQSNVRAMGKEAAAVFGANPLEGTWQPNGGKRTTRAFWHLRGPTWTESKSGLGAQYDCVEAWLSDPRNTNA
jgi:hypothetical protein